MKSLEEIKTILFACSWCYIYLKFKTSTLSAGAKKLLSTLRELLWAPLAFWDLCLGEHLVLAQQRKKKRHHHDELAVHPPSMSLLLFHDFSSSSRLYSSALVCGWKTRKKWTERYKQRPKSKTFLIMSLSLIDCVYS